jgi:hypothetical protein
MTTMQVEDNDDVILVEFARVAGVRSVSLSPQDIVAKSQEAIDAALKSMRAMAKKTLKSIQNIPLSERPNSISVSFGLTLTAEGGALLAKAGVEAAINVTMTWEHKSKAK